LSYIEVTMLPVKIGMVWRILQD